MPRFRPHEHLRKPAEFQAVYDHRRSAGDDLLIVFAMANGLPYSRIGLSVSRKHGIAVKRVRLRRLLRDAYRLGKENWPVGYDLVLVPKQRKDYELVPFQASIDRLVRQAIRKIERDNARREGPSCSAPPSGE